MNYTLRGAIANITPLTLDKTLSLEGASADAKAVGDAIKEAKETSVILVTEHINNTENPHKVTAEQLGLGNVNNTSDMDKPVSMAQAEAIADAKQAGVDGQELANKAQFAAETAQGTAEQALQAAAEAERIGEMAAGEAEANAKTYADSLHQVIPVAVPVSGWSEEEPFTQTIEVEGILETDTPHWGVVLSGEKDTKIAQKEAFALVDELDTADGSVTFTCLENKPEVDLTIQMEVNR